MARINHKKLYIHRGETRGGYWKPMGNSDHYYLSRSPKFGARGYMMPFCKSQWERITGVKLKPGESQQITSISIVTRGVKNAK